ncbi:MAG: TIGR01212 family radical SAM protein [Planctomycetia bacterium]|nr:TIGR01212 family radical SAM protein [Planctomycetia bacterium]
MSQTSRGERPSWEEAGLKYYRLNHFFQQYFGTRVWKVTLDAGFYCPNRDGTVGTQGCVFCNMEAFNPNQTWNIPAETIPEQIDYGIGILSKTYTARSFVAYFQPATNTYAPVEKLRKIFYAAVEHPQIVGLVIGTRPDCVGEEVLELLEEMAQKTWLSLELGLQSCHDRTLRFLRRGHDFASFVDAVERAQKRNLNLCAHVILGLPGETPEDWLQTADQLAAMRLHSVKIHNLYVPPHTDLEKMYRSGEISLPTLEEYVSWVVDFLERTPQECVIDRISGNLPAQYLIAPDWCIDRGKVHRSVEAEFARRGTCQGRKVKQDGESLEKF